MELNTRPPKYKIVKLVGAKVWRVVYWKPWGWFLGKFIRSSAGRWKTAKMERMGMHGSYSYNCEYDTYYQAEKACIQLEEWYQEKVARKYDIWQHPAEGEGSDAKES